MHLEEENRGDVSRRPAVYLQHHFPQTAKLRNMIPYWIELNPEDLLQGTVVMSLAVYFLILTLTSSARNA